MEELRIHCLQHNYLVLTLDHLSYIAIPIKLNFNFSILLYFTQIVIPKIKDSLSLNSFLGKPKVNQI